ncbi:extracellular solute-binding protein [Propionimicrobium sp. PCR01-08-3]|uniref:ABC transporter substrate-binding protein n=1 Tax=Propionimicrobium sp. PCR01-08-3 TaxID=3052086 RepID=UPI00255C4499|nr:extracellular solute-binding protein [Propionimicrobium sp. PCR01-08-3]WIY83459.1 extracellular solute-binding protein [Propionimicrobium sp. PCR01-08-3]
MKRLPAMGIAFAMAVPLAMSGCGGEASEESSDVVHVTLANHVWTENIKAQFDDFTAQTGIEVDLTQLGEDQLSDQYNVKLNAGSEDIDVMMYRPLQEGKMFAHNGWMADLSDKVTSNSDWEWEDYQEGPVTATTYEGKVVGVPIITETEVLYYRTDLLESSGYDAPPQTLDELQEMAAQIHEDNPDVAGFVARTGRTAAVTQFSSFLFSYGGDFDDGSGNATLDTQAAQDAYEMYGGLIRDYGPANVSTDMSWPEAMAVFTQGQAAFYVEANSLYKNATDPANSQVSDTVGFSAFPAGPAGSKPYNIPAWALGVNEGSSNIDNAWKFIEWATSKDQTLLNQQAGVPSARTSVWNNPEATKDYPADLVAAAQAGAEAGIGHDRPLVVQVAKAREVVGQPIVDAITGKDIESAIATAQSDYQGFLDGEE